MTSPEHKAAEARLRRRAARLGLELRRSRTRDETAPEFGKYQLWRRTHRGTLAAVTEWCSLDEIEQELTR
jgi:hypothetical protein